MNGYSTNGEEIVRETLRDLIRSEGLGRNPQIIIKPGSEAGDGYIGVNNIVEIVTENKSLTVFLKSSTKNEKLREDSVWIKCFIREVHFYDSIYPAFLQFQAERNVAKPFRAVPNCYDTSTAHFKEYLILENLKVQDYVLLNRMAYMDHEHLVYVFQSYARLHAVSYAMKDQNMELYKSLTENVDDVLCKFAPKAGLVEAIEFNCREALKLFDPVEDKLILSRTENMPETLIDILLHSDDYADEYSVIAHGDCWCNNFMFKYKNVNKKYPTEIKHLDWQLVRINSPVTDLCQFFYELASKESLQKLDYYMRIYHETLSENIRALGSDPDKLYPFSVFRSHWRKFSKFGLMLSFIVLKIMLTEKDEVNDLEKAAEGEGKVLDGFKSKIKNADFYNARIKAIIEHFVENEFI